MVREFVEQNGSASDVVARLALIKEKTLWAPVLLVINDETGVVVGVDKLIPVDRRLYFLSPTMYFYKPPINHAI